MKFKTLTFSTEKVERRLHSILGYIASQYSNVIAYVSQFEATGTLGNQITMQSNKEDRISISLEDILKIISSDQIIDGTIDLEANGNAFLTIKVLDGAYVDVYEKTIILPEEIIGQHSIVDE